MRHDNDQQSKKPLGQNLPSIDAVRAHLAPFDPVQLQIKIDHFVNWSGTWNKVLKCRFYSALSREFGEGARDPNVSQCRALLEVEAARLAASGVTAGVSDWKRILSFVLKLDQPQTPYPTIPKKKPA